MNTIIFIKEINYFFFLFTIEIYIEISNLNVRIDIQLFYEKSRLLDFLLNYQWIEKQYLDRVRQIVFLFIFDIYA